MTQAEKSSNKSAFIRSALNKKTNAAADISAYVSGMSKDVKTRWAIALGVVALGVGVAASNMNDKEDKPVVVAATPKVVDTTPPNIKSQSDWRSQNSAEVTELKKKASEQEQVNKELLAQMRALQQEVRVQKTNAPAISGMPGANAAATQLDFMIPPPPEPPSTLKKPVPPSANASGVNFPSPPPIAGSGALVPPKQGNDTPAVSAASLLPSTPARSAARAFIPVSDASDADEQQPQIQMDLEPNDKQGFLPAGSFANATLLSGVEALTGGTAQSQPQPIVIRIDHNAFLPNSASFQIKGCHVLASVWGDMSSERVYGRLATLTCVDQYNRLVLSEEVEGNLVDSDGKNGVRGVLQDRQGAKLARSLLAGFASGMATAFGTAQSTTAATAFGTTTALSGDAAVRAAGFGGANAATQKLAEFYLKQAESTMPVIAVDAGRKVSVLFTRSKSLKFESTEPYKMKAKTTVKVARSIGE